MDVVIPLGPNDVPIVQKSIDSCRKYIQEIRNIYVISFDRSIQLNDCIVVEEFFRDEVNSILPDPNRNKWYLQQLIKLYAHIYISELSDDYLVIDADTIFHKEMSYRLDGRYWFQIERRPDQDDLETYYTHAKKVHPSLVSPFPGHFFIHHQMIFNRQHLLDLFDLVESHHNNEPFWLVFCNEIGDEYYNNGASEYEIYAIFMCIYFPRKLLLRSLPYEQLLLLNEEVDKSSYWVNYHWYML